MMRTYSEHLAQVSTALADPTRREIIEFVLGADSPLSVREVADHFGLHANAARIHLDKLVKGGLLSVVRRRGARGGRPANLYEASGEECELHMPARRYKLLAEVLVKCISGIEGGVAPRLGEEAYMRGREEAILSSSPLARLPRGAGLDEVAGAWSDELAHRGLNARILNRGSGRIEMVFLTCPFGEFSRQYPGLVCEVHRRLEEGFLSHAGDWRVDAAETACTLILRKGSGQ
jgi:predicted ArsR family transcriptional regulator